MIVAKEFKTVNRRFSVGDTVKEGEVDQMWIDRGFVEDGPYVKKHSAVYEPKTRHKS